MSRNLKRFARRGQRSRSGGFTLVEVVVALSILALIMLATVSALRTFANTQVSLEQLTGRLDEVRSVSSFLRDAMESATRSSAYGGLRLGGKQATEGYFRGTARTLDWKSTVMFGEAYGGEFILHLAVEDGDLVLRWHEPVLQDTTINWGAAPARTLLRGVQTFAIGYRADFNQPWQNQWEEGTNPALVLLRIKTQDRNWPDLIMRVPL